MHRRATSHRRSVCAPRAIKNPSLKSARLSGGGDGTKRWGGNGGFRQCSEWHPPLLGLGLGLFCIRGTVWDTRPFTFFSFHLQILSNANKVCSQDDCGGKCDSPEDLCSLWTRARALNNVTKQFSRLSRSRNIHTKNQHFRYYISETQLWPLARFALALCVCVCAGSDGGRLQ